MLISSVSCLIAIAFLFSKFHVF